ncbi:hypothetical protein TKK_0002927 [Trichogramma kaykai]
MDKFDALQSDVMSRYSTIRDPCAKNDFFKVDISLANFRAEYEDCLRELNRISTTRALRLGEDVTARQTLDVPVLFDDDWPVLRLFVYGIYVYFSREVLTELLNFIPGLKVSISSINHNKSKTTCRIDCENLFTSCQLQCAAICKKIPWTKTDPLGNVKKGFIKIKPDLNSIMSSDPSANSPPEFPLCEVHPALRVAVIMDQILSLLPPEDQLNFYCWLGKPEFLLEIMLHYSLHFVWLRFLGDPSEVCAFVRRFRTLRFVFYREKMPVPLPCVSMLLRARVSDVPENSMCFLEKVDLTSVIVNNEFIRFVSGRFLIKELIIGQSTAHFESEARFRGVQYLTIKNNSSFRGSLLLSNLADSLLTVKIIACKNLIVDKLKAFLSEDSRTTAIVLDKIGIVKSFGPDYTHIFDGLFSGKNVIKSFTFTSPCMQVFEYSTARWRQHQPSLAQAANPAAVYIRGLVSRWSVTLAHAGK